ncbi:MAG: lysophospholipid acyltransferase family protein [Syntrophomonadaceae bacterium]
MLYWTIRSLFKVLLIFLGLKIEGLHKLPNKGPVIVAANHVSNWDPIVVAVALKRQIHFMAKAQLFDIPLLGAILTRVNAFPVRRGTADRAAIRRALEILGEGQVLGIFPEGTRNKTGDIKAQSGVAMIALKAGAPVLPVACVGTRHLIPCGWRKPFIIRVGDPIYFENYKDRKMNSALLEEASTEVMEKINSLLR